MQNKVIAFVLLCTMLIASSVAYASVPYTEGFATDLVKELEIMVGDSEGNMNLSANLTRAEFTKIAITASKYKNSVAHGAKISVFKDCSYTHWSAPYVKVAVNNGIVSGYPDGTFKPDNLVTYEEAFVVMLKLLGYTSEDFGNTWPYGQVSLGKNIGLGDNISKGIGDNMTRKDALILVYNTLNAKVKGSNSEYASQLDATLYENVVVIATNKEDTSIAPGSVLTSAGTYKYTDTFSGEFIGTKGDLAVKNNGEIICYTPYTQNSNKLVVYSILSNSVIVYDNGVLKELDINANTTVYSGADKLTFSSAKNQMATGDVVYVVKNSSGAVEYLTLTKDSLKGPETLSYTSTWYSAYTNDVDSLTVIRNGEKVAHSEVKTNDIIYYSKDLNTVFAYAKTTTGIYENALPNKDTPTSVVISGVEYQIESVNAFNKLSSSGNLSYGTTVTLLFGKDGKIADVVNAEAGQGDDVVGYLVATGKKNFENSNNESYTSRYISLIMPDGSSVEYITDRDYATSKNSVVRVTFNGASAKVTKIVSGKKIGGLVSSKNMTIGDYKVANNIKILDVSTTNRDFGSNWISTYMQRLDGITLSESAVLWCNINKKGEVDQLILNRVTGDTSLYGIATKDHDIQKIWDDNGTPDIKDDDFVKEQFYSSKNYAFDVNGRDYNFSKGILHIDVTVGTATELNVTSQGSVEDIKALKPIAGSVDSISATLVTVGDNDYKMSDKVIVYKKTGIGVYSVMPLSEIIAELDNYNVKAYYDKTEEKGGRVRILIAQ